MTTKHTPGPWIAADDGWIDGVVEYAGCGSHEAEWSNPANKALVLAAPALLEALSEILDGYLYGCDMKTKRENIKKAHAAIALATLDTSEQSGL